VIIYDRNASESLVFDAVLTEDYEDAGAVSDHPTVDIETVVDNTQEDPLQITITGRITATPVPPRSNTPAFNNDSISNSGPSRIQEAINFMEAAKGRHIQWYSDRYGPSPPMIYGSFSYSNINNDHVDIDVSLTEIELAEVALVELPPERVPDPKKKPDQKSKNKSADAAKDKPTGASLLAGLADVAGLSPSEQDRENLRQAESNPGAQNPQ